MPENETDSRPDQDVPMKVVHTANGEIEAETIRATLEAAGIPVAIRFEAVTKLFAVNIDGLGAARILVPEDRLDEARAVIETPAEPLEPEEEPGPQEEP